MFLGEISLHETISRSALPTIHWIVGKVSLSQNSLKGGAFSRFAHAAIYRLDGSGDFAAIRLDSSRVPLFEGRFERLVTRVSNASRGDARNDAFRP